MNKKTRKAPQLPPKVVEALEVARAQLLDLHDGWSERELCESIDTTVERIDKLIGTLT